jgi:hypothetical protein
MADDREVLSLRLSFALCDRDWPQAKELIQKMKDGEDDGYFAYAGIPPVCRMSFSPSPDESPCVAKKTQNCCVSKQARSRFDALD